MRPRRHNPEAGFTLLEVLVAMALLGFLSTMLLTGVQLATRIMDGSRKQSEKAATLPAVHHFLRTQIAQALPILRESRLPTTKAVAFDGDNMTLRIVTIAPSHLPPASLGDSAYQSLLLELDTTNRKFVITWQPYARSDDAIHNVSTRRSVLLESVAGLEIEYFGSIDGKQLPTWHREWKNQPGLPILVRIRLTQHGEDPMPDLTVALRLSNTGL